MLKGPPKATVARRCQSYSDFHYAVKAIFSQEGRGLLRKPPHAKDETDIKTELDFADWYQDLEQDLLDASHDEYM